MASSEVQANAYQLWKRFSLPVEGGTKDSIAVKSGTGTNLVSAYTLMVKMIVTQLWALVVLAGMIYSMKMTGGRKAIEKFKRNDNTNAEASSKIEEDRKEDDISIGVISASIFISKSSAPTVLKLTVKYFIRAKQLRHRYFSLIWMAAAALFLSLGHSLPIIITRYLIVGHAAPVVPEAVYVPDDSVQDALAYQVFALKAPTAFRALGDVHANTSEMVTVDPPNISSNTDGNQVIQIGYRYNITGVDLGLQYAPDLLNYVQGSCVTEYSWFYNQSIINTTTGATLYIDRYLPWNDSTQEWVFPSYNAGSPYAHFFVSSDFNASNQSFGILISSFGRESYTRGEDPWYLTTPTPTSRTVPPLYVVKSKRPALSCWQQGIWSYNGHTTDSSGLVNITGLNAPKAALSSAFEAPMIVQIGQWLDRRALQSVSGSIGSVIDAEKCSMQNDLKQLVFASYLASKNVLSDSTTYGPEQPEIRNLARDGNGKLLPGAADFVIYSKDVDSLSIRVIIVIPTILCALALLVTITTYKFGVKPAYKKSMAEYWSKWVDPIGNETASIVSAMDTEKARNDTITEL